MGIQSFFKYFSKLPSWKGAPPQVYDVPYGLNNLSPGVDNIRIDVHLSPYFRKAIGKIVWSFLVKYAKAENYVEKDSISHWSKGRDEFKGLCSEVLNDALEKAKLERYDPQIDYLAQTAIVKILLVEIRIQFESFIESFNNAIWEKEISSKQDLKEISALKEKTGSIRQNRKSIIYQTSKELFGYFHEIQIVEFGRIRSKYFGDNALLPDEFFVNPILYKGSRLEDSTDDFIMMEEYVLMGRRLDDVNTYSSILGLLISLLNKIEVTTESKDQLVVDRSDWSKNNILDDIGAEEVRDRIRDSWLKSTGTIDTLFDYFATDTQYSDEQRNQNNQEILQDLKKKREEQQKFLNFSYRKFQEKGLVELITATSVMKSIYQQYCPPLVPQQVLQYLVAPKSRNDIEAHLNRIKRFYGKPLSIDALNKAIKELGEVTSDKKKLYLVEFMKGFTRYHRDLSNFSLLRDAMNRINLISDEKTINLSRANNTLFEFLLPMERLLAPDEKPVASHVIIKADLRGSTDIIHHLLENRLNPASYFSLNFFDPISDIVSEYGASKVFIEGDAIILAILERQVTRSKSFSVARACGLALNMLIIIQRYNTKNAENNLPRLEMGMGIDFEPAAPTYLFDEENKIMISPAIISADRLSCSMKPLRKLLINTKKPFNTYCYQGVAEKITGSLADDMLLRYNINGIALSAVGFKKLTEEIELQKIDHDFPEFYEEGGCLYTGKFPTVAGKDHHLIIREAAIPEVNTLDFTNVGFTEHKYYEVCSHPKLYEFIKKKHL